MIFPSLIFSTNQRNRNQNSQASILWSKIAASKDKVFGVYSGRSGSLYVAAFNGVNCFYWDFPYMEIMVKEPYWTDKFGLKDLLQKDDQPRTVKEIPKGSEESTLLREFNNQLRQTLRCMQLLLVTGIGYPLLRAQAADPEYAIHHPDAAPLAVDLWLNGSNPREAPLYPPCPKIPSDTLNPRQLAGLCP